MWSNDWPIRLKLWNLTKMVWICTSVWLLTTHFLFFVHYRGVWKHCPGALRSRVRLKYGTFFGKAQVIWASQQIKLYRPLSEHLRSNMAYRRSGDHIALFRGSCVGEEKRPQEPGTHCSRMCQVPLVTCILLVNWACFFFHPRTRTWEQG